MLGLDRLVEERIQAAIARGELDRLPGAGKPLELDDDFLVPAHLRAAYRILKNAGYVPPEIETLREMNALQAALLAREGDDEQRRRARVRLQILFSRLEASGFLHTSRAALRAYEEKLLARMAGGARG